MARPVPLIASAAFDSQDQVDRALQALLEGGVARDLIEVATDPATAVRAFPGGRRRVPFELLSGAGRGGLIGLIVSVILSLSLTLLVSLDEAGPLAIVQLLGPNVGMLGGAVLGALWAWWRPRPTADRYCRVRQTGGILVIVQGRTRDEAEAIARRLTALGGREALVEPAA